MPGKQQETAVLRPEEPFRAGAGGLGAGGEAPKNQQATSVQLPTENPKGPLIEEPENGIHPMAMETVYQALRSVYGAQILLATHSTVILGCARAAEILCFKKDEAGATDVVSGPDHPALRQWQGGLKLSDLYASGVLG
jgi:hypothetical protein